MPNTSARSPRQELRTRVEQQLVRELPLATRLLRAVDRAKARRVDVSRQLRVLRRIREQNRGNAALTRQLRVIEEAAYSWPGWRKALGETRNAKEIAAPGPAPQDPHNATPQEHNRG